MSFTVYGIRLKGTSEVRYIGHTRHSPEHRLASHRGEHGSMWAGEYRGDPFGHWLRDNGQNVEAFEILRFETREEAKIAERALIQLAAVLRQRLFNADHFPRHLKAAA